MYPVSDIKRARAFYENLLHLVPGKISAEEKWVEYDLPQGGCFAITTMATGVIPSATAGGSVAFEVDNLDELMISLKANNIAIKLDTFISPVCRMSVIIDSEGNAVILHQLNAKPC